MHNNNRVLPHFIHTKKNSKMLGRNTYIIPQVSSSHHHHIPRPIVDLDGVEILLHHHPYLHHHLHHQTDAFPSLYLAANAPAAADAAALFNQESGDPPAAPPLRKQTAKKDRHSKINTAQGPRDRRVRLSIGIARKFFDLQEMLGFDKPSKTLDWLLTKSKAAIKELVQTNQSGSVSGKSGSSPSACELISCAGDLDNGADSKRKFGSKDKAAKESRAKARARARERTLEKMCIKQLGGSDLNSSFECRNNQLEFLQLSAAGSSSNLNVKSTNAGFYHCPLSNEAATMQDLSEDQSIVIKRKNKNPSHLGFQQNLVFSRDLNSNYMIPSANANENWDVFGLTSQSNLHAVFDQHKFFNSNSNI